MKLKSVKIIAIAALCFILMSFSNSSNYGDAYLVNTQTVVGQQNISNKTSKHVFPQIEMLVTSVHLISRTRTMIMPV